ncbi:MAG: VWA domain-containing protein [Planctomycetes bacterium]|nr:VWA domain-containing protein [Planctomycetota bacterium]
MRDLRFVGDLTIWIALPLAIAAAALAWWVYRRETRTGVSRWLAWGLPTLRTLAIFLIVLMLAGPVLHHREVIGELGRVIMFVDASRSMSVDDQQESTGRKLLLAQRRGWVPPGTIDTAMADVADQLDEAQRTVAALQGHVISATPLKEAAGKFAKQVGAAGGAMNALKDRPIAAPPAPTGSITRELWWNLAGNEVEELTERHKDRLDHPEKVDTINVLATPRNLGDNYEQRIRGYIHPPTSGKYTFWLVSDDNSELWLSDSADPSRKQRLKAVKNYVPMDQWPDDNRTEGVTLEAGKSYYIEVLHKEGTGDDFAAVGWQLPDGTMERPIPGSRLSPVGSDPGGGDLKSMIARFRDEVISPAERLANQPLNDQKALDEARAQLVTLAAATDTYEKRLRGGFEDYAAEVLNAGSRAAQSAVAKFDTMSRYARVESLLLDEHQGLLAQLREKHHVELMGIAGGEPHRIWTQGDAAPAPQSLDLPPTGETTDLTSGVKSRLTALREGVKSTPTVADTPGKDTERTAVVIITDGQHNDGPSPIHTAQLLGQRQIPLFTIGLGADHPPHDLAIMKVFTPESVSKDDRVRGEVIIADHMPAGQQFTLRIEEEGQPVWEQKLTTQDGALRRIPFDFPIDKFVDAKLKDGDRDVKVLSLPMAMQVSITPLEGEVRKDNNTAMMHFTATTQDWKMLVIDGRARWETRYIRNLFERDSRWKINEIIAGPGAKNDVIKQGDEPGMFPKDAKSLFAYDLIVLGELRPGMLSEEEMTWLREFVQNRGGGMIILDGQRGHLREYLSSPLGDLIPVNWTSAGESHQGELPQRLAPTELGLQKPALLLASDPAENGELWHALPPPHWVAPVQVTPGAGEVLLEAVIGEKKEPVMVERRFGAGKVIYLGEDESWRWRYEVADTYHARFWNQLASYTMETPYAVSDQFVSIDAGGTRYRPGASPDLRVRLRDGDGKPVLHATAEAVLKREGRVIATVLLDADPNQGGIFRGKAPQLGPGEYEVSVRVTGFPEEQMKAKTSFVVEPAEVGEMATLVCNEDLLKQMSTAGEGEFLREEQADRLPKLLEPLSAGRVVESETALWQSYWWFVPIIGLLSLEWFLRKRTGML